MLRTAVEVTTYDNEFAAFYNELMERFVRATADQLRRDREAGRLRDIDPDAVAQSLVWMVERCNNVFLGTGGRTPEAHRGRAHDGLGARALSRLGGVGQPLTRHPRPAHGHTTGIRAADRLRLAWRARRASTTRIFARLFAWAASKATPEQIEHRRRLLDGLSGRVIEVGAGNGLNFTHYPPAVTEVLAVEPEPYLRNEGRGGRRAARRCPCASSMGSRTRCRQPTGSSTQASHRSCCARCRGHRRRLAELHRVIRPAASCASTSTCAPRIRAARAARTASTGSGRAFPAAAIPNRDTPASIEAAGFEIERCDRFKFKPVIGMKVIEPHVIGVARTHIRERRQDHG